MIVSEVRAMNWPISLIALSVKHHNVIKSPAHFIGGIFSQVFNVF